MIDGGAMCPHYYCHSPGPGPPITRSVFINNQNTSLHHMFLGIAVLMLVSALASLVWYQDYRQWETTVERPMRLQQCPRVRPCLSLLINISLLFLLLGSHPLWWLLQPSQEDFQEEGWEGPLCHLQDRVLWKALCPWEGSRASGHQHHHLIWLRLRVMIYLCFDYVPITTHPQISSFLLVTSDQDRYHFFKVVITRNNRNIYYLFV